MLRHHLALFAVCAFPLVASLAAQQSQSRCADCHFANPDAPGQPHLMDWDRSLHGRNGVGCERCHGGNPTTVEKFLAHRDMLPPSDSKSPISRRNLPTTCGSCHVGPFVAFQGSRHYELLQGGSNQGPTCSTCHGEVIGQVLSPKALERRCNSCHGPGETAPRAERARQVRLLYESLSTVRDEMKLADRLIRKVQDQTRRKQLAEAQDQAQVPLTRAINAGHTFVYDELRDYLAQAQQRVSALLARLADQPK
jgi:hypothetical protein